MNNTNQNHTDNFFKQGLSSPPEFDPSEKNWEEMERLLKPETKRLGIAWIYPLSGIAAAMLVFLSFWFSSDRTAGDIEPDQVVKNSKTGTESDNKSKTNIDLGKSGDNSSAVSSTSSPDTKDSFMRSPSRSVVSNITAKVIPKQSSQSSVTTLVSDFGVELALLSHARYVNIRSNSTNAFVAPGNIKISVFQAPTADTDFSEKNTANPSTPNRIGKWALSLTLSPDVNSVKGIDNGDLGMSMGMGLSFKPGETLSIGTGFYYSQKLYSADKASYKVTEKPFATWTSYSKQIDADCRVLDIPLNLSLRVSSKTENKVYASAGLSSYFMLSEKYDFIYNSPSPAFPTGRREYTVHNQNKHILSVVNLGVALEKPISKQVSLVIQPYAKIPLTGIGQGETDLKSFGMGFRLDYSLKRKL